METFDIVKSLLDLGLSAILLYFLFVVWKDRKEMIAEKNSLIAQKDKRHEDLTDRVIAVVEKNTEASMKVSASVDAQIKVGESQQRALETLTEKVYDVLVK